MTPKLPIEDTAEPEPDPDPALSSSAHPWDLSTSGTKISCLSAPLGSYSSPLCCLTCGCGLAVPSPPGVSSPVSLPEVFPESRMLITPPLPQCESALLGLKLSATGIDSWNRGLNVRRGHTMGLNILLTCVPASSSG